MICERDVTWNRVEFERILASFLDDMKLDADGIACCPAVACTSLVCKHSQMNHHLQIASVGSCEILLCSCAFLNN